MTCGQKWLATFTPFFTERERREAGCQHRLFFTQVELCDNLIFRRRAALDRIGKHLLDANRTIGQPDKITVIFGWKITRQYGGELQTVIEDMHLPNPVIRSHYGNGFVKQYVRRRWHHSAGPAVSARRKTIETDCRILNRVLAHGFQQRRIRHRGAA